MRGARKGLTTSIFMIVLGLLGLAIVIPAIRSARQKAQAAVHVQEQQDARQRVMAAQENGMPVHPYAPDTERFLAEIRREAEEARENGVDYNPHVHMPDGRHIMVQDEHMVRMMKGEMASPMQQSSSVMAQEAPKGSAWCVEGEHLPDEAPEGSMTGCQCGAKCDPDTGKPIGRENANCKRHCHRDDCMCGNCI